MENVLPNENVEQVLQHWGIKGMRWGVRRTEKALAANKRDVADLKKHGYKKEAEAVAKVGQKLQAKLDKKKGSEDYQKAQQLKSKGYKNLSDKELKDLTTRMNLERNFRDLKSSDQQRGLDFVKTITAVGTTMAGFYALSQTPLAKDIGKAISTSLKKR